MRQFIGLAVFGACIGGLAMYPPETRDEASRQAETVRIATVGAPLPPHASEPRASEQTDKSATVRTAPIIIVTPATVNQTTLQATTTKETFREPFGVTPRAQGSTAVSPAGEARHETSPARSSSQQPWAPPQPLPLRRSAARPRAFQTAQPTPKVKPTPTRTASVSQRPPPPKFDSRRLFAHLEASGR